MTELQDLDLWSPIALSMRAYCLRVPAPEPYRWHVWEAASVDDPPISYVRAQLSAQLFLATRDLVPDVRRPGRGVRLQSFVANAAFWEHLVREGDDHVFRVMRAALQRAVLHELDEHLLVDGLRRWDPHAPIDT